MKHLKHMLFIAIIGISFLSSCEKDDNIPEGYRPVNIIRNYHESNHIQIITYQYEDNHMISSISKEASKNELFYRGDSVIYETYLYNRDINDWKYHSNTINKYNMDNLISSSYLLSDSNIVLSKNIYNYDARLIEINGFNYKDDFLEIYESTRFDYVGDNLSIASFYYKAIENEDIVEHSRREFTYDNNLLIEELVFTDYNGYPIQLYQKKIYSYGNNNEIAKVEYYIFEDNEFSLSEEEIYSYDGANNLINRTRTNISGTLTFDENITYENGTFKHQLIYNPWAGVYTIVPTP